MLINYTSWIYTTYYYFISFSFPKNDQKCKVWVNFVGEKNWKPQRSHVLCSRHFSEDCFDKTSRNITRLKPDAVPTIYITRIKHVSFTISISYIEKLNWKYKKLFFNFNSSRINVLTIWYPGLSFQVVVIFLYTIILTQMYIV